MSSRLLIGVDMDFQCIYGGCNDGCTYGPKDNDGLGVTNKEEETGLGSLLIPSSHGDDVREMALHYKDHLVKEGQGGCTQ